MPLFERDGPGRRQIFLEHGQHLLTEIRTQDNRVQFIVVQETAPIQIGRSYRRPHPVDERGLGVQQGGMAFMNFNAATQQLIVIGTSGMEHQAGIGVARQDV